MAELAYFFDGVIVNGVYDRRYSARDMTDVFDDILTSGVLMTTAPVLSVVAAGGMLVSLTPGRAYVRGVRYKNTENLTLTIDNPDGVNDRIDTVVIRLDRTNRLVYAAVVKGDPSASPVHPVLSRSDDVYEIGLYDVRVGYDASSLSDADITDMRGDATRCGAVTGVINQVDLSTLYTQFEAQFVNKINELNAQFAATPLGSIQAQIDKIKIPTVVNVTTNKTLVPEDAFTLQKVNSDIPVTISLPPDSLAFFQVGTVVEVQQFGPGSVSFNTVGGAVLLSDSGVNMLYGRYTSAILKKESATEWSIQGAVI